MIRSYGTHQNRKFFAEHVLESLNSHHCRQQTAPGKQRVKLSLPIRCLSHGTALLGLALDLS